MGVCAVLDWRAREKWLQELEKICGTGPDLHYNPEYCGLFGDWGDPRLFVYREGAAALAYPFIMRKVNDIPWLKGRLEQNFYDITSPYGYGGPLASQGVDDKFKRGFYQSFSEYCEKNNIITEFIRFHPLLGNQRLVTDMMKVERASSVVFVDLTLSEEDIWRGYERNNRKNINKAIREGLEVILEDSPYHFADFIAIYRHTLTRNQAGEFYFFDDRFFDYIHWELKGNFIYAHTLLGGRVVSTELLLHNETYIHSFLGGTLEQFYQYRPNNILKHEVIKWAKNRGIKYFLLGGGYREGDGIFRYKRSFATEGVLDFFVGKKVHNHEAVKMLEDFRPRREPEESKGYFPPYRR